MSGDTFTITKFKWLDGVLADTELTPSTFKIAYLIATRHLNRVDGSAWPSYKTLAKATGVSEKSAMRAVGELQERGHLEVTQRGNIGKSNIYKLTMRTSAAAEVGAAVTHDNFVTPDRFVTPDNLVTPTRTEVSVPPGQDCPPNPLMEPIEENPKEETYPPASEIEVSAAAVVSSPWDWEQAFEELWSHYPRKDGKKDAKKAFKAALKLASLETITAGVMRYAAQCTGKEQRHIKMGGGWFRDERWNDPVVSPVNRPAATSSDRKSVMADVSQMLKGHARARRSEDSAAIITEAPRMRLIG